MKNLNDIEKIINSELTTKINNSIIKHDNLKLFIEEEQYEKLITKNDFSHCGFFLYV